MPDSIQFTYNKFFAYSASSTGFILFIIFFVRTFQLSDPDQIIVLRYFDLFLIIVITILVIKYFIPATRGEIALELSETGLRDKARNITVEWADIQALRILNFPYSFSKGLALDLVDKKRFMSHRTFWQKFFGWMNNFSFGTPLIIPLQYVTGDNSEILKAAKEYFEKNKLLH